MSALTPPHRTVAAGHCVVCDADLDDGQRLYCSDACNAEAARWRAILEGRGRPYRSLRARLAARGRRTRALVGSR
jgi:predicted nucleic acid-binding Zn ribbon protein